MSSTLSAERVNKEAFDLCTPQQIFHVRRMRLYHSNPSRLVQRHLLGPAGRIDNPTAATLCSVGSRYLVLQCPDEGIYTVLASGELFPLRGHICGSNLRVQPCPVMLLSCRVAMLRSQHILKNLCHMRGNSESMNVQ